jgi:phage shock protein A
MKLVVKPVDKEALYRAHIKKLTDELEMARSVNDALKTSVKELQQTITQLCRSPR